MIYESVDASAPVRQGDIFRGIPRIDFSLSAFPALDVDGGAFQTSWREYLSQRMSDDALTAVLSVKPVDAIVITQDCDASRGEFLSLCQISDYSEIEKSQPTQPKKWQSLIVRNSHSKLRYFYLPAFEPIGFAVRRAVDFRIVLPVKRPELYEFRDARIGRLNRIAYEHFRESLAQFFRRYPYNEWYPLTGEEFAAYAADCEEAVAPYPWQLPELEGGAEPLDAPKG